MDGEPTTLAEVILIQKEVRTRLDDHIRQCDDRDRKRAMEMAAIVSRQDSTASRMMVWAGSTIGLLLTGLLTVIGLLINHMLNGMVPR